MHVTPNRTGREWLEWLWKVVRAVSHITVLEAVKLDALSRTEFGDADSARVQYGDGSTEWIDADTVVLATKGFGGRRSWVDQHIPVMREACIEAAINVGATTAYMDAYQGHATVSADPNLVSHSVTADVDGAPS